VEGKTGTRWSLDKVHDRWGRNRSSLKQVPTEFDFEKEGGAGIAKELTDAMWLSNQEVTCEKKVSPNVCGTELWDERPLSL